MYWNLVWDKNDVDEYRKFIGKYDGMQNCMTRIFKENNCITVCDAACGFGANSLILLSNGFDVHGFDISEASVWLTCNILKDHGIKKEQFKVASLYETGYEDGSFDAVAIRAALDHLSVHEFELTLDEMKRIIKPGGLLYASFDPLEDDDINASYTITDDGSYLYNDKRRNGLLFHYYSDEAIKEAFREYQIIHFETGVRGNRHIIVKM